VVSAASVRFVSTQALRSMFNACKTFSACKLRAGYGFTTSTSTGATGTASASLF